MCLIPKRSWFPTALLVLAGVCQPILAGETTDAAAQVAAQVTEAPAIPQDQFDRGTPLRSAEGFLIAADDGDFEKATEYLDLRNLRGAATELTGEQLARRLFVIIRRGEWAETADFVDDPAGRIGDGLPDYRDSIGVVRHQAREVQLYMQKVPRGDGVTI